ncbi:MAG: DUF166 domain-containing protein [Chloroflexi bacterium]|nr:DUF166 domain-containing protein [Chloroflexota bacterium]
MRILAIVSGEYGQRNVRNIHAHAPKDWQIETWQAPVMLPPMIDDPEDHLPDAFSPADLILSFAEIKGVAELLPDIAQMSGAKAVVVSVDNETWLPLGLASQLRGWLKDINVACATPKPLCSLTQNDYGITRQDRIQFESPEIAEFARYFGKPDLEVKVDPDTRKIASAEVKRDAVCGNARHVAAQLIGLSVDEVEAKAGLLHHHYPCLATMTKLDDFNHDTLMHESGHQLTDNIGEQVKPFKKTRYITPGKLSE